MWLPIRFDDAPEERRQRDGRRGVPAKRSGAQQRAARVGDGQRENEERHAGGKRGGALLPAGDGRGRQDEPEQQASAVTEENRRRREVVDEEAQRGADQRRQQHRFGNMAARDENRGARCTRNHRKPRPPGRPRRQ